MPRLVELMQQGPSPRGGGGGDDDGGDGDGDGGGSGGGGDGDRGTGTQSVLVIGHLTHTLRYLSFHEGCRLQLVQVLLALPPLPASHVHTHTHTHSHRTQEGAVWPLVELCSSTSSDTRILVGVHTNSAQAYDRTSRV